MSTQSWRVERVDHAESTQDLVLARATDESGLVIWTTDQRAGRGRGDRTWTSPRDSGIAMSILLRPHVTQAHWTWLPLLLGSAACRAVRARGLSVALKWPNDIVIEDDAGLRKVGGILATVVADAVVLGIGINVRMTEEQRPEPRATSLALEGAVDLDEVTLVNDVLEGFVRALDDLGTPDRCRARYRDVAATIGRTVEVLLVDGSLVRGDAVDVDGHGSLVVRTGDGDVVISAGDVTHVR